MLIQTIRRLVRRIGNGLKTLCTTPEQDTGTLSIWKLTKTACTRGMLLGKNKNTRTDPKN